MLWNKRRTHRGTIGVDETKGGKQKQSFDPLQGKNRNTLKRLTNFLTQKNQALCKAWVFREGEGR